jgi:hypothetical protein
LLDYDYYFGGVGMKKNYDPKHLNKKQRHMKKWIPKGPYCHGMYDVKYCPFWQDVWSAYMDDKTYDHQRSECQFADKHLENCTDDCSQCREQVSKCTFLNYTEYGQYPLGDMCKVCGIHENWEW